MSTIDAWAALAAFIAGSAVAIRARMLRPRQEAWTHAPGPVWLSLGFLALALAMSAVSLVFGAHASPREAMVYTVLAVCSVVMLLNLNRNGRAEAVRKAEIANDVRVAMEASGRAASYPHEAA